LAAAADERQPDARHDAQWQGQDSRLVRTARRPVTGARGPGTSNYYGIQDLHGLVWEWLEDFNALMVSGDSREQGDRHKLKFCGAGALSLKDRENYAVLMRIAFLSAIEARSTAHSLGFRCAAGVPE
jgi:formylglycine-generating enzyme required for sulfatase activity